MEKNTDIRSTEGTDHSTTIGNEGQPAEGEWARTKIICTLGPASCKPVVLERMIRAGMDAARLNFSHGNHENHLEYINAVRTAAARTGRTVAIIQDLQGPKIRLGSMAGEGRVLEKGQSVRITSAKVLGTLDGDRVLPVDYPGFTRIIRPGQRMLLDDGLIMLRIVGHPGSADTKDTGNDANDLEAIVEKGGPVFSRKGINLPDTPVFQKGITEKDREDLRFGIENDLDFVAISFVGDANDVRSVREIIHKAGKNIRIIAKIERATALDRIHEIIHAADGILVARGDLGVEIPIEMLPITQKDIIHRCSAGARFVVTATHMLESMINNRFPTRAEVLDVANAVMDGTDSVMLSAETAIGKHPIEAVAMMARIVKAAESTAVPMTSSFHCTDPDGEEQPISITVTQNVARAAGEMAERLNAKAIVGFTMSGTTALILSKTRHNIPIIALTPHDKVRRQMSLLWGVVPIRTKLAKTTDDMIVKAEQATMESGLLKKGDLVVFTAGVPLHVRGRTNMIKVHEVGSGHWTT